MKGEKWSTEVQKEKVLKTNAAGPVLGYENGKLLTDSGEGHAMIIGSSGTGKSRRETVPTTMTFIKYRQSGVIVDPKGEIFKYTKDMIPEDYDVHVIDFRNIYEDWAEGWNPLDAPYALWKTGTAENRHIAEQMIEELAFALYPDPKNVDPFWRGEARNVFIAAVYALFGCAKEEEINLASVYYLISQGDEKLGSKSYLRSFVDLEEKNENIAMQLYGYVTTADETRCGIRSIFLEGLSMAGKSESVRNFLSHNDFHIHELRGDKPTLIYIIVPDETPIYDDLTGVLVSQIMNHYIRIAGKKFGDYLPVRVNVLLEELGNIGHAIMNLPHLLSAGRSRNIRVMFVLQTISQLVDIYGKDKAETIIGNCNVRILFRVNNWDTLTEFSRICGEKEVRREGCVKTEALIKQSRLADMKTGQALVLVSGRLKFVTRNPDFTEMSIYRELSGTGTWKMKKRTHPEKISRFDLKTYVVEKRKEFGEKAVKAAKEQPWKPQPQVRPWSEIEREITDYEEEPFGETHYNINEMIERIDREIEELEKEQRSGSSNDK